MGSLYDIYGIHNHLGIGRVQDYESLWKHWKFEHMSKPEVRFLLPYILSLWTHLDDPHFPFHGSVQLASDVHKIRCEEYGRHVSRRIGSHGLPQLADLPPFPYARVVTRRVPNRTVYFEFQEIDGAMSTFVDDFSDCCFIYWAIFRVTMKFVE